MINEQRMTDLLLELIRIDSEPHEELNMCERLVKELESIPGVSVRTEGTEGIYQTNGYNIIGTFPGTLAGAPVLLSAHMDTVVPGKGIKPVIKDGIMYSDGTTILAGDDKCGIVEILETVRSIAEDGKEHRSVEVLFSVGEETGLWGAKALDASKLNARQGYVVDVAGKIGKIVNHQPGQYKIHASVTGKRAHAGNFPEKGVSAIQTMAEAISNMHLLRIDPETTANVGEINAKFPTNIVPDSCTMVAEIRSRNAESLEREAAHMEKCLADACAKYGASYEFSKDITYMSYKIDESEPVLKEYLEALKRHGIEPNIQSAGGGSDANIYNQKGFRCIVLADGDMGNHALDETVDMAEFFKGAVVLEDVLTH